MTRVLIISTDGIYLANQKECRRSLKIATIKHLVKSKDGPEILIYFVDESDLRIRIYNPENKEMAFLTLFARFCAVNPKVHLKLFEVPEDDLKKYRPSG